jgi:hypothetical protein
MADTFLKKVRPDFIQIDCKGHPARQPMDEIGMEAILAVLGLDGALILQKLI